MARIRRALRTISLSLAVVGVTSLASGQRQQQRIQARRQGLAPHRGAHSRTMCRVPTHRHRTHNRTMCRSPRLCRLPIAHSRSIILHR